MSSEPAKGVSAGSLCTRFQDLVLGGLERAFYNYGKLVSRYPAVFIVICVAMTGLCSIGFLFWEDETDGIKLWQPQDSEYVKQTLWLKETFPSDTRFCSVLFLADNVVRADIVKQIYGLYKEIAGIKFNSSAGSFWFDLCQRVPGVGIGGKVGGVGCMELSVLQLFVDGNGDYDETTINALTDSQVVDKFNAGIALVDGYIGSQSKSGGKLVSGKATTLNIIISAKDRKEQAEEFELKLINLVNDKQFTGGLKAYPLTARSFGDLIGGNIQGDLNMLASGYLLIFLYVCFNLGRRNSVEHRVWLSTIGIVSVGMGIGSAYGLCQLLGFFFTNMHGLLPFLMLGVGIDDMFVIMQAWENLEESERMEPLLDRFGLAMKHAGVAVTITSVTDLLAFFIGATTVIPALSSFCVYAAFGILFIYYYQTTFFLAWFSLDQRRVEDTRDGCICCWKKTDWEPSECSKVDILAKMFSYLATGLESIVGKVVVLLIAVGLLTAGIYGVATLRTEFDYSDWVDEGTYLKTYMQEQKKHFPSNGMPSTLYTADLQYAKDLKHLDALVKDLVALEGKTIQPGSVDSWLGDFIAYANTANSFTGADQLPASDSYSESMFRADLKGFLSSSGIKYKNKFELDSSSPPKVLLTKMEYNHIQFETTAAEIDAMEEVFALLDKNTFSGYVFASGETYGNLITLQIMSGELIRNVIISMVVVFVCTLFLIADVFAALIVVVTVTMTVVNVAGFANYWGLTVDLTFAIFLQISIGLCVDYSAHIAHQFMTETGDRQGRMRNTMVKIGPAVLNGGISTFVAFVLLAFSKSKPFFTFFKIFFLVVWFGLAHGLFFLPVILSLIGPASHRNDEQEGGFMETNKAAAHKAAVLKGKQNQAFINDQGQDSPTTISSRLSTASLEQRKEASIPGSLD